MVKPENVMLRYFACFILLLFYALFLWGCLSVLIYCKALCDFICDKRCINKLLIYLQTEGPEEDII